MSSHCVRWSKFRQSTVTHADIDAILDDESLGPIENRVLRVDSTFFSFEPFLNVALYACATGHRRLLKLLDAEKLPWSRLRYYGWPRVLFVPDDLLHTIRDKTFDATPLLQAIVMNRPEIVRWILYNPKKPYAFDIFQKWNDSYLYKFLMMPHVCRDIVRDVLMHRRATFYDVRKGRGGWNLLHIVFFYANVHALEAVWERKTPQRINRLMAMKDGDAQSPLDVFVRGVTRSRHGDSPPAGPFFRRYLQLDREFPTRECSFHDYDKPPGVYRSIPLAKIGPGTKVTGVAPEHFAWIQKAVQYEWHGRIRLRIQTWRKSVNVFASEIPTGSLIRSRIEALRASAKD